MEGSGQLLLGRIDVWLYGSVRLAVVHHNEGLRSAILGISVLFMVMATFMSHTATTNLLMPIAISMSTSVVSIENMGCYRYHSGTGFFPRNGSAYQYTA